MTTQTRTAGTTSATTKRIAMRTRHTLFAVAVALTAFGAQAATASAEPTGGNAPAAMACQKGGYQSLARAESPSVAFTSNDECTSYAAQGGTLTPLQTVNPFEEACEAIENADYIGFVTGPGGTVNFFCDGEGPLGLEPALQATLQAACEEMNGSFEFREYIIDGHLDSWRAACNVTPS